MNIYKLLYEKTNDIQSIKRLGKEFGSCNLYVPKKIKTNHYLSSYTKSFISALEDNYGGKVVYIPIFRDIYQITGDYKSSNILYKIKSLILKNITN
jgi:hypothetical protein